MIYRLLCCTSDEERGTSENDLTRASLFKAWYPAKLHETFKRVALCHRTFFDAFCAAAVDCSLPCRAFSSVLASVTWDSLSDPLHVHRLLCCMSAHLCKQTSVKSSCIMAYGCPVPEERKHQTPMLGIENSGYPEKTQARTYTSPPFRRRTCFWCSLKHHNLRLSMLKTWGIPPMLGIEDIIIIIFFLRRPVWWIGYHNTAAL